MDAIEFFQRCRSDATDFEAQVNAILKLNGLALKLDNGKITNTYDLPISRVALDPIEEAVLKELLLSIFLKKSLMNLRQSEITLEYVITKLQR